MKELSQLITPELLNKLDLFLINTNLDISQRSQLISIITEIKKS